MYKKVRMMEGIINLDTLYLVVKYPYLDVFKYWNRHAEGIDYRKLKEGIVFDDFVLRGGASCYKISLWQHDARVYLTDQVDEKLGDDKGAGIWVQLGPKFIMHYCDNLHSAVRELLYTIGVRKDYPTKINRIDLAIDLFGVDMKTQDINLWKSGWVGRSKVSGFHMNSRTGDLETINIGSRKSPIFLRIYDKVAQATFEGDLGYWRDVWKEFNGAVTRVEWEIKPSDGKFAKDLQDFSHFQPLSLIELLNYLLDWGRLCIPNQDDSNNRRWPESEFWKKIREFAKEFSYGIDWPTSRYGKEYHGINDGYLKLLSGTLSGAMARFNKGKPNMADVIWGLEEHGHSLESIQEIARKKAELFSRL